MSHRAARPVRQKRREKAQVKLMRREPVSTQHSLAYSISRSQSLSSIFIALVFGITFCLLLSAPYETGTGPYVTFYII